MIQKLSEIKKEITHLNELEIAELCLRLAKYKKENKELLTYLLFYADDALAYAEQVKASLEDEFKGIKKQGYFSSKTLRKILRIANKHIKFTGSKQVEVEILIWFCKNYLIYADSKTGYKPLRMIFVRQLIKLKAALTNLHEDLQFDYNNEFADLLTEAVSKLSWFSKQSVL